MASRSRPWTHSELRAIGKQHRIPRYSVMDRNTLRTTLKKAGLLPPREKSTATVTAASPKREGTEESKGQKKETGQGVGPRSRVGGLELGSPVERHMASYLGSAALGSLTGVSRSARELVQEMERKCRPKCNDYIVPAECRGVCERAALQWKRALAEPEFIHHIRFGDPFDAVSLTIEERKGETVRVQVLVMWDVNNVEAEDRFPWYNERRNKILAKKLQGSEEEKEEKEGKEEKEETATREEELLAQQLQLLKQERELIPAIRDEFKARVRLDAKEAREEGEELEMDWEREWEEEWGKAEDIKALPQEVGEELKLPYIAPLNRLKKKVARVVRHDFIPARVEIILRELLIRFRTKTVRDINVNSKNSTDLYFHLTASLTDVAQLAAALPELLLNVFPNTFKVSVIHLPETASVVEAVRAIGLAARYSVHDLLANKSIMFVVEFQPPRSSPPSSARPSAELVWLLRDIEPFIVIEVWESWSEQYQL